MRHVAQKSTHDCGVACIAMVANLPYRQAVTFATPDQIKTGMYTGQLVSALKRATKSKKWKLYAKPVPIPLRYYTPRVQSGILVVASTTPAAVVRSHFVAYSHGRIFDPDEKRSMWLDDMKRQKQWRYWAVTGEIGRT